MHIHPSSPNSSPSEENAAIKIQAGFRGYRVRKQLRRQRPSNGYYRAIQNMTTNNGNAAHLRDERSSGSEGSSVEDKCATKIQANVRGFLVRKKQKMATDAATKIQASFRGFKARKEAQKLRQK
ncbi:abnormal spindle-like microcephaly-associated protein homolog [Eupeodes corollae]|uniref:abnormal spindle-like microcephaly-associated protein homolog n=1 Tax=Eupeodes corollae TaxID=290404 RepID=UPI0024939E6D|nr:abnormal spindle-like microcephaly-associated protein homolog [Eupeodes corollae]